MPIATYYIKPNNFLKFSIGIWLVDASCGLHGPQPSSEKSRVDGLQFSKLSEGGSNIDSLYKSCSAFPCRSRFRRTEEVPLSAIIDYRRWSFIIEYITALRTESAIS